MPGISINNLNINFNDTSISYLTDKTNKATTIWLNESQILQALKTQKSKSINKSNTKNMNKSVYINKNELYNLLKNSSDPEAKNIFEFVNNYLFVLLQTSEFKKVIGNDVEIFKLALIHYNKLNK